MSALPPIVLQKSFCIVDHKNSAPWARFSCKDVGGSHDLALNSSATSVISPESPLFAVLACLRFCRKNQRSAFSDFCNKSPRKRTRLYAAAGRCARRKERICRTASGIRSFGSFHGNMLTSAFGASIAASIATA